MHLTFDPVKDAANVAKHGISLSAAADLDWANALTESDDRHDYCEDRMKSLAPMNDRIYAVVWVQRGDSVRVISLRKANLREAKLYANQT